ncbi:MAG: hypothetical protein DMD64_12115 [Gemmatimonadetes bacterium]|nr:MAG: hypothetical protein DMD64_12115 [Gemmatimonadota bacterium]
MYSQAVLTALLAWPVVAAAAVLLVPERWAKHVALAASLLEFAISVPLWWTFRPAAGMQFVLDVPWISFWGIRYTVGVDGISLFMVLLTTFLVPLSVLGSYAYITTRERGFYALLLVLTSGMIGVFVSLDLFLFYVMWEVMLIPMYFIIGVWGGERRLYAAIKFFIYTFFGSLLMLVAILVLVSQVGHQTGVYSFSYAYLTAHLGGLGSAAFWLFGAFFLAFAIKVPMFPFHTWLPDAHVEAPTAGSVILAGVLLKMGTYGFLRFALPLFPAVALHPAIQAGVVTLALIGIVYGGAHRLLLRGTPRLRDAGDLGPHAPKRPGRPARDDQPRHLHGRAVLPGRDAVRAAPLPPDRRVRRYREGRAAAGGGAHDRLALLDRAAGHERIRRRVPGVAGRVPDLSARGHRRDDRRDRGGDVLAARAAARHLQPARQAREREARRPDAT